MNFTRKRGVCSARCLLILFLTILSSSVVAAQTATQATLPAETRIQIENAVSKFMATTSAPGIAVAVVMNGEEVWSEGFGMADLENSVPVAPQTLFRLASVSKPITATATMELWERHQLDLDAPVQKYCPAFPKKEFPISTRLWMRCACRLRLRRCLRQQTPQQVNSSSNGLAVVCVTRRISPPLSLCSLE